MANKTLFSSSNKTQVIGQPKASRNIPTLVQPVASVSGIARVTTIGKTGWNFQSRKPLFTGAQQILPATGAGQSYYNYRSTFLSFFTVLLFEIQSNLIFLYAYLFNLNTFTTEKRGMAYLAHR